MRKFRIKDRVLVAVDKDGAITKNRRYSRRELYGNIPALIGRAVEAVERHKTLDAASVADVLRSLKGSSEELLEFLGKSDVSVPASVEEWKSLALSLIPDSLDDAVVEEICDAVSSVGETLK